MDQRFLKSVGENVQQKQGHEQYKTKKRSKGNRKQQEARRKEKWKEKKKLEKKKKRAYEKAKEEYQNSEARVTQIQSFMKFLVDKEQKEEL